MKPAATSDTSDTRCPACGHPLHRAPAVKSKPAPLSALLKRYELEHRCHVRRVNGGFV